MVLCVGGPFEEIFFSNSLEELKAIRLKIRRIILEHLLTFKTFHPFIISFLSSGGNFIESGKLIVSLKSKV